MNHKQVEHADSIDSWHPLFRDGNYQYVIEDSLVPASDIFSFQNGRIDAMHDWPDQKEAPIGMIITNKKYSSYNLELEFKFGKRSFKPRLHQKKDAGLLFHAVTTKIVWPPALEYQIQEGDCGDLWVLLGVHCEIKHEGEIKNIAYEDYSRSVKFINAQKPGWNKVRLEVRGDHARYYLNGKLVNEIVNATYNGKTLNSGRIALQAEYAEISYRNVRILEVDNQGKY